MINQDPTIQTNQILLKLKIKTYATETKPSETYDVKKAQELWAEGLKEEVKKKVTLTYYTDDQTINKNIAQFVQSQVETQLKGTNVEVHSVPAKNAQDNVAKGNFDIYFSLWLADYADPMSDMDIFKTMVNIVVAHTIALSMLLKVVVLQM